MNGDRRGLDISIQVGNAPLDFPQKDHVLQIYDAKFRKNKADRITHPEFAAFAHWVELFELRGSGGVLFVGAKSQLRGNCLVTNGRRSTEKRLERVRTSVREVENFIP